MAENLGANEMPNRNDCGESYEQYLKRAVDACEAGDLVLGMHLYLAAYEKSVVDPTIPDGMALSGLREAWRLACELKERSMAEYVFEKLEPYLTGEEIAACAQQLQDLALDRLEQYGFSRQELEDMAEMISQDFVSGDGSVVKVESIAIPNMGMFGVPAGAQAQVPEAASGKPEDVENPAAVPAAIAPSAYADEASGADGQANSFEDVRPVYESASEPDLAPGKRGKPEEVGMAKAPVDFNPYSMYEDYSIGKSYHAATNEGSGAHVFTRDKARAEAGRRAKEEAARGAEGDGGGISADEAAGAAAAEGIAAQQAAKQREQVDSPTNGQVPALAQDQGAQAARPATAGASAALATKGGAVEKASQTAPAGSRFEGLSYRNLVGYDETVSIMRDYGIGLQNDRAFLDFVEMLNQQHGISRAPALDSMLFRAPAIEDASRFVEATIGEIGLPVLHMSMEEGYQGAPVLCVTTQGNHRPRMNHANNRFEAPAILVIDDLDNWVMPSVPENAEGMSGFIMANISRGAREAVNLIRSAVEDPDVYVLATATTTGEPDPFFYDMLEPLTVIDIGLPNDKERADLWAEIARDHPSMRQVSRADLMRYSEGMPRYDIYIAAREALEEAYKLGLVQRGYVPVSAQNIFEKLAACQPLDSDAYRALEDAVVRSFQEDLDHLEDLLDGSWS